MWCAPRGGQRFTDAVPPPGRGQAITNELSPLLPGQPGRGREKEQGTGLSPALRLRPAGPVGDR